MTAPTVLPGRTSSRLTRKSRLLFHYRADRMGMVAETGQALAITRATVGGQVLGADGRFRDVGQYQPRFQMFDDGSGTRKRPGLVVESQRTNRASFWRDLDNAAWTKSGTTVSANAARDPSADGIVADKLVEDNANSEHGFNRVYSITAGERVAWGLPLKAAGRTVVRLYIDSDAAVNRFRADFDLSAGTVTVQSNQGTGVQQNARIEALGDGWYWCEIGGTVDAAAVAAAVRLYMMSAGATTYVGDASSGVLVGGQVFRRGSCFVGSPVAAPSAEATSNADAVTATQSIDPRRHPNLTLYAEVPRPWWADATGAISAATLRVLQVGGATNAIFLRAEAGARTLAATILDGSGNPTASAAVPSGSVIRVCAQFRALDTGGYARIDVGSGFSAETAAAAALAAFTDTSVAVGSSGAGNYWESGIFCLKVAAGLFTLAQMQEMY